MLTKLLVTAAVILGVLFYLRQRNDAARLAASNAPAAPSQPPFPVPFRILAYGLAGFIAVSALGYVVYDYHDSRRLLSITVVNPLTGEKVEYKATKGQLNNRSFETVNGQTIRVSDNERLVIEPLDD